MQSHPARRSPLLLLLLAHAAAAVPLAAQDTPRGLEVEQAMALRQAANPQLGDGFLAYTLVVPRPLEDGPGGVYLHVGLFDNPTAARAGGVEPRMLVTGKDSAPGMAVRPGTRSISFVRESSGKRQVCTLSIDGGEPEPVADTPAIAAYRWRPDGRAFAFTSVDPLPAARAAAREHGFRQVIVDEDWRSLSLWVWEPDGGARRLTEDTSVFDFAWSPDGARIACACAPRNLVDDSYMFQRLRVLDVASGRMERVVDNPGKLGSFAWSPDGERIAYVAAADVNDPHAGMLYIVDVRTAEVRPLTHGLQGMVQQVATTGSGFLVLESIGVKTRLRHLTGSGEAEWRFAPESTRLAISGVAAAGSRIAFAASSPEHPDEIFLPEVDTVPRDAVRLTDSNPELQGVALGEQTVERFRARDGLPIEGLLIKPLGFQADRRHPLVIVVHGGPEAHHSDGWLTSYSQWGQLLAARGYVSWYPNYRASTGYGVEFCKQDHGDPMGREFDDHLDAIDHFAARGMIDPERVGIGGGSYGGYTAAWAATRHSARFAAAVSFVPFVDIRTKWLTSDIPWEFYYVHYQQKWPWQQPGLLADRSPLTWAEHCDTPLLLLGGTDDTRVHPSQPLMLYRAVKFATDTPVRLVQYPGEGHGNRTNVYRYDYALRSLRWFDWYLQGEDSRRDAGLPPFDLDYVLPE